MKTVTAEQPTLSTAEAIGRRIVPKSISFTAELLVQLRQVTMRFEKVRRVLQRFLIRQDRCAFLLSIFKHDPEIEMCESQLWLKLQGPPVTAFSFGEIAEVVMQ